MTVGVKSGPSDPGTRSVCISFWMTRAWPRPGRTWMVRVFDLRDAIDAVDDDMRLDSVRGRQLAGSREHDLALFQTVLEQFVVSLVARQGSSAPVEHQARHCLKHQPRA